MGKIKWHITGILIYSFWAIVWDYFSYGKQIRMYLEYNVLLMQLWIFYSAFAFSYYFFESKKKILGIGIFLLSLFGTYLFEVLYVAVRNYFYQKTDYVQSVLIYRASQSYSHTFFVGIGFFFLVRFLKKQKENNLLIEKNLTLQKDLSQSENDFLRAQINPHFLHNCLNYFYAETMVVAPRVGDGIVLLSEIMRYSITDFSATNGLAELAKEVENIDNVIQLNKFRFENALYIKFDVVGDAAEKYITPMILISLVENMFKHGDLQDETSPASIHCTIDETTQSVIFVTSNKSSKVKSVAPGGLGTVNIIKRLELLYGNNYTLAFEERVSVYTSKLVIPYYNSYIKKMSA